ncbi:hypothetical protein GCM10007888_21510 [Methylobacterium oxalidis]|uniref:Uncharacterized protein n=1 Tax=Methylobacterium oxalidis TaxID=944322 RepID=A0ABQ6DGV9_9HYPH|nr:hypothetical protein GCM10007888_21510 [Methylobacterium oxalidis]
MIVSDVVPRGVRVRGVFRGGGRGMVVAVVAPKVGGRDDAHDPRLGDACRGEGEREQEMGQGAKQPHWPRT